MRQDRSSGRFPEDVRIPESLPLIWGKASVEGHDAVIDKRARDAREMALRRLNDHDVGAKISVEERRSSLPRA
jgi:hypothetical protein